MIQVIIPIFWQVNIKEDMKMVIQVGNEIEIVNNMYDIADLIQPILGYDVSDFIRAESKQFDKEKYLTDLKFNSDFNCYEAELDSHNTAFTDLKDGVNDLKKYIISAKRLDRDKILKTINNLMVIIENEGF